VRLVFDTNILVLSLMGEPATAIVEAAFADTWREQLLVYYSEAVFREYQTVLTRLTLRAPATFSSEAVAQTLERVKRRGHLVHPILTLEVCSHAPDNRILECAFAARADYLVTVNVRHFPVSFYGIKTFQPHQFYDLLFVE
jgi:putative PIN family toxin of toxin-antitoxin system